MGQQLFSVGDGIKVTTDSSKQTTNRSIPQSEKDSKSQTKKGDSHESVRQN